MQRASSMKRSASMKRAASRSASRGKAKARSMGRAKRGGEETDLESGHREQVRLNEQRQMQRMEEGRSESPPPSNSIQGKSMSAMEEGRGPKLFIPSRNKSIEGTLPTGDEMVGGKRRKSKKYYKGKKSKTRKGRKDFVTHKGDKYYHRKGHRQTKRQNKKKGLFEQLFGV
jgi:hypothetical protein